MLTVDRFI